MPYRARELGNNAKEAIGDVDELLECVRRALRRGIDNAYDGDVKTAGKAMNDALNNVVMAQSITTLILENRIDRAATMRAEYQNQERGA